MLTVCLFFGQAHKVASCYSCCCSTRTVASECILSLGQFIAERLLMFRCLTQRKSLSSTTTTLLSPTTSSYFFFCIPKPFKAHSSGTWANFICINNKYYSYAALHGAQLPPFPTFPAFPPLLLPLLLLPDAWQH